MISAVNLVFVGLFGGILSASFCDIKWTKRTKWIYIGIIFCVFAFQAINFTIIGRAGVRNFYPLTTHLPLMVALAVLSKDKLWGVIAVLSAYVCCQLRRWVALFAVVVLAGGEIMQDIWEIAITVPMLLLILKYVSPSVREMSHNPFKIQLQFAFIPAVFYAFDYVTRVYTNWLDEGIAAAVEFMPFVSSAMYLFFVLRSNADLRKHAELEQEHAVLDLQLKQAAINIEAMKKSQEIAAEYRHDLRHHLQYISSSIEEGNVDKAQEYIGNLNEEITKQTVTKYCENTLANLVLSSFAKKAAAEDIEFLVNLRLGEITRISETDFCVLLSNAMENAINACKEVRAEGKNAFIEVHGYSKAEKLFLEIVNSCGDNIVFNDELPVTAKKGHGIGVKSICAVTEKYSGLHSFEAKNGKFVLRLSV